MSDDWPRHNAFRHRRSSERKRPPEGGRAGGFAIRRGRQNGPVKQGPAFAGPDAIPTVDFLLHHPGVVVKKMGVKSQELHPLSTARWEAVTRRGL
jgi:hypothetical protein